MQWQTVFKSGKEAISGKVTSLTWSLLMRTLRQQSLNKIFYTNAAGVHLKVKIFLLLSRIHLSMEIWFMEMDAGMNLLKGKGWASTGRCIRFIRPKLKISVRRNNLCK